MRVTFLLACAIIFRVADAANRVIKLGIIYDASNSFLNAYLGTKFYAYMINKSGGLVVGMPGNETTYDIAVIGHSDSNISDPYWISSGSG